MILPFAQVVIHRQTKQLPEPWEEKREYFRKFETLPELGNNRLVFTLFFGSRIFETNATFPNVILVSTAWAVLLLKEKENGRKEAENAFLASIGHELTHKDPFWDGKGMQKKLSDMQFVRWVTEVRCDFGGAEKILESSREKAVTAAAYKRDLKKEERDWPICPSWAQREGYLQNYNYDEKLIEKFAEDTKCTNEMLIESVKEYCKGREIRLI